MKDILALSVLVAVFIGGPLAINAAFGAFGSAAQEVWSVFVGLAMIASGILAWPRTSRR